MPKSQSNKPIHPLRHIKTIVHLLKRNKERCQTQKIYAKGFLIGQFLFNNILTASDQVVFSGDFNGYFEEDQPFQVQGELKTCEKQIYFEGSIESIQVDSINNKVDHELIDQLENNTFHGYFKGMIFRKLVAQPNRWINVDQDVPISLEQLKDQNFLQYRQRVQVLIPTFVTFVVKNLNSISFESSSAKISSTLSINMQLSQNIMKRLQQEQNPSILMALGRENSIQLPLKRDRGQKKVQDYFIQYQFKHKTQSMKYIVRRTFQAGIDNTHGQFYAPFNLMYLKIVLTFAEKSAKLHHHQKQSLKQKVADQGSKIHLKFLCYDLDDTLEPNNPYSTYNELQAHDFNLEQQFLQKRMKTQKLHCGSIQTPEHYKQQVQTLRGKLKLANKVSKIHLIKQIQCGDHLIASSNLSFFPFYREAITNRSKNNTNYYWNMGFYDRHRDIVPPRVLSISQEFKHRYNDSSQSKKGQGKKLFLLKQWNHVHIQVPIYRYWTIYLIQICLPLLILSTISMFIFLQENGLNSNGYSTFNQRIANGIALLLAYGAMIPALKQHMAQSTFFSFFQLVIYLSIVPMILALVSSIIDSRLAYSQWKTDYQPFSDPFFLISFIYVCFLVLMVFIIIIIAVKISLIDRQARVNYKKISFKRFGQASESSMFKNYIEEIKKKRKGQYKIEEVRDIDKKANPVPYD